MEKKSNEKEQGKPMSIHQLILVTSIFGSLLWGGIHSSLVYFHFSEVSLMKWMDLFRIERMDANWQNYLITILIMCVVSYIICYFYYLLFRAVNHFAMFVGFGVLLFIIFFIFLQPITPGLPVVIELSRLTNITNLCIFVLYGTFIGYTISFEHAQTKFAEHAPSKKMSNNEKKSY